MARWTQSRKDIEHIAKISDDLLAALPNGPIVTVVRKNEEEVEGLLFDQKTQNNVYMTYPATSCYSEITLMCLSTGSMTIDVLDIQSIVNSTSVEKLEEYRKEFSGEPNR